MQLQRDFFNSLAHKWDKITKHDPQKIKKIINMIDIHKGSQVLDVGSGTGILIPYILEKTGPNGHITELDFAYRMLEKAKEKFPPNKFSNLEFTLANIINYNTHKQFDYIICYSCFPHFNHKEKCIKKMASLLKPKGKLIICHSESRDKINSLHILTHKTVASDILPPAKQVAGYMSLASLRLDTTVDNNEMYVVIGYQGYQRDG